MSLFLVSALESPPSYVENQVHIEEIEDCGQGETAVTMTRGNDRGNSNTDTSQNVLSLFLLVSKLSKHVVEYHQQVLHSVTYFHINFSDNFINI